MNERDIKNSASRYDEFDGEGGEVAAILSALPRVEAPGNFEFGVRSRIANATRAKARSNLVPFFKIAGPLTLVMLIGVFLFYATIPATDPSSIAEVSPPSQFAENTTMAVSQDTPLQEVSGPRVMEELQPEDAPAVRRNSNATYGSSNISPRPRGRGRSADMPRGGGSVDQTIRSGRTILPPGIADGSPIEVPVRDVLGILGITADFASGEWKIRSVVDNSIAFRAGFRAADIIEAIDGRPVKDDSKIKGSAKTFAVRRDGKQMNLTIGN